MKTEKAIVVGTRFPRQPAWSIEDDMDELAQLAQTAGAEVLYPVIQHRDRPHPSYFIGKGKAEELAELGRISGANLFVFNNNLTGSQVRNLEQIMGSKVIDRTELILDIFAQRARTREGRLQVELAQLQYLLPRLVGKGVSMSRLGGGIGTRGPGETKLEADRRRIRDRVRHVEKALEKVKSTRALHRKARQAKPLPVVSLVGYTNSGKSTLLNRLTKAGVLTENKLFSTLDPTARRLQLPNSHEVILIDTVGFIGNLPHTLVSAFKATLEETVQADLLLHVVDISHPSLSSHMKSVNEVLSELNVVNKDEIVVYNKIDRVGGVEGRGRILSRVREATQPHEEQVFISALYGEGIQDLLGKIEARLCPEEGRISLILPYDRRDLLARIYSGGKVLRYEEIAEGMKCVVEIPPAMYEQIRTYVI